MTADAAVLASPALPLPDQLSFKQHSVENDYIIDWGQELGVGASGFVRRATSIATGKHFAVKFLADSRPARQEIACWATCLPHPHILPITDVYECEMTIHGEYLPRHWLAVVTPLMEGGELYFEVTKRKRLPENDVKLIAYQLLHAVAHTHLKGVCHRDVKLENILLQQRDSLHVRLADFGFATGLLGVSSKFTLLYVAPEILRSFQFGKVTGQRLPYGALCDEWSIGVCVYMMLSGSPPFPSASASLTGEYQMRVLRGRLEFPERDWAGVSTAAKAFVSTLLTVDPGQRATCARALAHPWLAGVTLQGIAARAPASSADGCGLRPVGSGGAHMALGAFGAGAAAVQIGAGAGPGVLAGAGGVGAVAGAGAGPGMGGRLVLTLEDNNIFRRRTQRRTANNPVAMETNDNADEDGHATPIAIPPSSLHAPSPAADRSRSTSRASSPQLGAQAFRDTHLPLTLSCSAPAVMDDSGLAGPDITIVQSRGNESSDDESDDDMRGCSTPTPLDTME